MNRHTWREVRRQLKESGAPGLVAVLLVTIATAWGGVVWTLRGFVVRELLDRDRQTSIVAVVPEARNLAAVDQALRARFTSAVATQLGPGEVQKELAAWFPEISTVLLGIDQRSFPPLLQITAAGSREREIVVWLRSRPDVSLVESSGAWQDQLEHLVGRALAVAFAVALTLLVGCAAVLLLVVRLLVVGHADEVAIMRLIGAREHDIRIPYLACGSLLGLAGGLFGCAIYAALAWAMRSAFPAIGLDVQVAAALPVAGILAGCVGAGLGIVGLPSEP